MTDISLPAQLAGTDFRVGRERDHTTSDFRVGRVLDRTAWVLSRNFLTFFVVYAIAYLPATLLQSSVATTASGQAPGHGGIVGGLGFLLTTVLGTLSQAIVVYGAFQDMRGRPVSLTESLQVSLRRFFPIVGLGICVGAMVALGFLALVIPGLILLAMWYIATPACVVEQLGPLGSMRRSSQLTKGYRWKIFGLMLLLIIIGGIVSSVLAKTLTAAGGTPLKLIGDVLWNGVWGAVSSIAVVVTYHDLRVAKEGIDVEQVASVFD
jgi:hypothetical protein